MPGEHGQSPRTQCRLLACTTGFHSRPECPVCLSKHSAPQMHQTSPKFPGSPGAGCLLTFLAQQSSLKCRLVWEVFAGSSWWMEVAMPCSLSLHPSVSMDVILSSSREPPCLG